MQCLEITLLILAVGGMEKIPSSESYVNRTWGETGRYIVTSKSPRNNYLCHYGNASFLHDVTSAFSKQCFLQNKDILTDSENKYKIYPYFNSTVGTPPGCGSLPNVSGGEWVCPDGVSPISVPVYELCRLRCLNQPLRNNTIKVRCTEKLDWDNNLSAAVCPTKNSTCTIESCGSLPNVSGGEWVCPNGVSPISVPVYERCRLRCLNQPLRNNTIKVRCTEKLDWDNNLSAAVCPTEKNTIESPSDEDLDTSLELPAIITAVGFIVLILLILCAVLTYRYTKCKTLRTPSHNNALADNAHVLFDKVSADGDSDDGAEGQTRLINKAAPTESLRSNIDIENEKETSNRASEGTRPSCIVLFQQLNSSRDLPDYATEAVAESRDIHKINTCYNDGHRELNSLPLSPFVISNDKFVPLDIASLEHENSEDVRENVAFIECHPEKSNYAVPEILQKKGSDPCPTFAALLDPCPTFAAMLEGALEDSVRFVDDLSTLLDLDVQYKNPRNWQGLAQTLFSLSYNKIMEIRHKTKDHFREGVLPLLSCYGYRIYDVTYYFYNGPSRRVDVIECIQRYHPYCQQCGELYNCHRSEIISNVS